MALGVIVLMAALFVSLIAALILVIGIYEIHDFSLAGLHGVFDPATGPLIRFGTPYAFAAISLGAAAWTLLREKTDLRATGLSCVAALLSGAYLLSRWPFTSRNFSWLPYAIFGVWTTIVVASLALASSVGLWVLGRRLSAARVA